MEKKLETTIMGLYNGGGRGGIWGTFMGIWDLGSFGYMGALAFHFRV